MKLFYREFGEGFPLIILHGLYGSSDNWISIARELSGEYRLILPDQRNHGQSPHSPVHDYQSMSEDLHELVGILDLDKFILVGHSMGGKTAAYYARRWPDSLSGLVIIDITPFSETENTDIKSTFHHRVLEKMLNTDPALFDDRAEADRSFKDVTGSEMIRKFLLKNLTRDRNGKFMWKLNPGYLFDNLANIYDGFQRPGENFAEFIRGFQVLFLRAMESGYIQDRDYEAILKLFPASEIIEVPDASHWIHAEKPELIINLIRDNFPV